MALKFFFLVPKLCKILILGFYIAAQKVKKTEAIFVVSDLCQGENDALLNAIDFKN